MVFTYKLRIGLTEEQLKKIKEDSYREGFECVSHVCVTAPPPEDGGAAAPGDGEGEEGEAEEDWFSLLLWLLLGLGILGGVAWWLLSQGSRGRR